MTNSRLDNGAERRRNLRVASVVGAVACGMLGMAYAAVPLYQMFCQVTGFAGTPKRVEQASNVVLSKTITVRFDANINPGLGGWQFQPVQRKVVAQIGENKLIFYKAKNTTSQTLVGTATFNVAPGIAGAYFSKLECFCFREQRLAPGESVEMPVSFYIDPAILKDADARKIKELTLSYTFYPAKSTTAAATASDTAGTGG